MTVAVATLALLLRAMAWTAEPPADEPEKTQKASANDLLAEGRAASEREQWDEALEKFRTVLDADPKGPQAPEARFWVGFCLVKTGENEKAVEILTPFTEGLSGNKWADDALLQIGNALRDQGKPREALAIWKKHLETYPESVWRTEVALATIDLLFRDTTDLAECLKYCERLTRDVDDRAATTEARYNGAYCLNALRRFDEAERWADRLFDPENPQEEAWRRLLTAQRDLLRGRVESALALVDSLGPDFPDLDHDGRHDLLLKTSYVLRFNGRADRARQLLEDELYRSAGRPEEEVQSLLDELGELFEEDRQEDYFKVLARLSSDPKAPIVVRVAARDRHAQGLREGDHPDRAEALLRDALASETAEFPRFRAGLKLAEVVSEDPATRSEVVKLLDELHSTLKRRDLARRLKESSDSLGNDGAAEGK